MKKLQLEMGGKNPQVVLDDAESRRRGQRGAAERVLLDRPALHGVVAPHRHRRHSRPFVEAMVEAHEHAQDRRRAEGRHRYRPGRRPEPARRRISTYIEIAQEEGGKLVAGGERLKRDDRRLLPRAGADHRDHAVDAHQPRGGVRPGGQRDPRQGLRRGARGRQRHAVRPDRRASPRRRSRRGALQAQRRRPGW